MAGRSTAPRVRTHLTAHRVRAARWVVGRLDPPARGASVGRTWARLVPLWVRWVVGVAGGGLDGAGVAALGGYPCRLGCWIVH